MSTEPIMQSQRDERMWGMFCHLSAFAMYLLPYLGNIIGLLIVWLIKKDQYPLVDDQGQESANFQISITIYTAALAVVGFLAAITIVGLLLIPALLAIGFALLVFQLVMIIVASIQANEGVVYRYPLNLRIIR